MNRLERCKGVAVARSAGLSHPGGSALLVWTGLSLAFRRLVKALSRTRVSSAPAVVRADTARA